jgi:hypothetical protein
MLASSRVSAIVTDILESVIALRHPVVIQGSGWSIPDAAESNPSTRIFLTFVDATDIACHTKIRQAHDFGCMQ